MKLLLLDNYSLTLRSLTSAIKQQCEPAPAFAIKCAVLEYCSFCCSRRLQLRLIASAPAACTTTTTMSTRCRRLHLNKRHPLLKLPPHRAPLPRTRLPGGTARLSTLPVLHPGRE